MLSVFDLRAQDKDGKDVQIEPEFTGGTSPPPPSRNASPHAHWLAVLLPPFPAVLPDRIREVSLFLLTASWLPTHP